MQLTELFESAVTEAKMVWARKGKQIARKFRCTVGNRKGRVVSNPSQCFAPVDLKKRYTLKRTKARHGAKMARKAKRTKKFSAASRMVRQLNK
jgi:hypothetical protein